MNKGVYTALVTPFNDKYEVDYEALNTLLDNQISAGVTGIIALGTTAESPTLTTEEKLQIVDVILGKCKNKLQIFVCCGSNCTASTLQEIEIWNTYQIDGILLNLPAYNKPNKNGLEQHISLISSLSKHPIILYNVPSRTSLKLGYSELNNLCKYENIVAIKEASGDLELFSALARDKNDIVLLSGNDPQFLQSLQLGGDGIVSVASNLFPERILLIYNLMKKGKVSEAQNEFSSMEKFLSSLFWESNPIPIKYYLSKFNICSDKVRLPLGSLSEETKNKIDSLLNQMT